MCHVSIPKADFRNPERVGQAKNDTSKVEAVLDKLRATKNPDAVPDAIEAGINQIIAHVMKERKIPYGTYAAGMVRDELGLKLQSAHKKISRMKDATYTLEKSAVALEVFSMDDESDEVPLEAIQWKIARYVLNLGIMDVMAQKARGGNEEYGVKRISYPDFASPAGIDIRPQEVSVISQLNLSTAQAKKMLEIVEKAVAVKDKQTKRVADTMKAALKPYKELRGQVVQEDVNQKLQSKAGGYHVSVIKMRCLDTVGALLKHEAELDRYLTIPQVQFLCRELVDPNQQQKKAPPKKTDIEIAQERGVKRAAQLMAKARRMPAATFEKEKSDLSRSFVTKRLRELDMKTKDLNIDAEVTRVCDLVANSVELTEDEFEEHETQMAEEIYSLHIVHKDKPKTQVKRESIRKSLFRVRSFVSVVRRLTRSEYDKTKESRCQEFIHAFVSKQGVNPKDVDVKKETTRICAVLDRARDLDQKGYVAQLNELVAEACPRRCKPRAPRFTAQYIGGKPTRQLGVNSQYVFSEAALEILKKIVEESS